MKILNLYAGLGGNRKLWGDSHEVTAVELMPDIAKFYKDHFPNDEVVIGDAHDYLLNNFREFDFIWSSVNCPTHSRARFWSSKNGDKVKPVYPDMKLYEEILFLDNYFDGLWIVENVVPYYDPLIKPTKKVGRHLFWSNFRISDFEPIEADINRGSRDDYQKVHGISIDGYKFTTRTDKILRNCVQPETGKHILDCANGKFNFVSRNGQMSLI